MVHLLTVEVGAAAIEALSKRLDERRIGDPLAPATVLCQTSAMSVQLRRAIGMRSGGVAGVNFTTISELADHHCRTVMAANDQYKAARSEMLAAVRSELHREPGRFGAIATHRTTEERLLAFHQELVGLPFDAFQRLEAEATELQADALRVVSAASRGMGKALSGDQLIGLAETALTKAAPMFFGPLTLFLPDPVRPYEGRLIRALSARDDCEIMIGITGDRQIDRRHFDRLAAWGIQVSAGNVSVQTEALPISSGEPNGETSSLPSADDDLSVRSATLLEVADPEDEVRAALRDVMAHAVAGVPLEDMAILYTTTEPYARILQDQLVTTGLPFGSAGFRPLAGSLAGRTMARLLDMAAVGPGRAAVIGLVTGAPINDGSGEEAPATLWDRLSRQAGVIDGTQWATRLKELEAGSQKIGTEELTAIARLAGFVGRLEESLRLPDQVSWTAWSQWATALLDELLIVDEAAWPAEELEALGQVRSILASLGRLDRFDQPPTVDSFAATLEVELEAVVIPGNPIGQGLYVGPIGAAPGMRYRRTAVVGLVEGRFPRNPREDSLLPDQLRANARGLLVPKSEITHVDRRLVALAVASSADASLLLTSRGDLRSNRSRAWPRVLDGLVDRRQSLDSHYEGLAVHGHPISEDEFALRSLINHVAADNPVNTHELALHDEVLSASLARFQDRSRSLLTRHAGGIPDTAFDPTEQLLSPTALETYAMCPRKYLFQRVLRLSEDERPERIDEITARDRGTLIHAVLEEFIAEAIADDDVPLPDERWPASRRARMLEILEIKVKEAEGRGITGGQVQTTLLHRWLSSEVADFLDTDDKTRALYQSQPVSAEYSFGFDDSPALEGLWAGRKMKLRGSVDRVDTTDDDGLLVIDYKGGSDRPFAGIEQNPLNDGRRLQLPLYARAVAEQRNRKGTRVGIYWLTKKDKLFEMVLDDALEASLEEAVGAALDGIAAGVFPGIPGDVVGWPRLSYENCRYCDFDRICPTDRQSEWDRVRDDPVLTPIDLLLGRLPDATPVALSTDEQP